MALTRAPQRTIAVNDAVTVKYLPDWGIGAVTHHFEVSGLLRVEFEVDGRICASEFHPGELQHARATVSRLA